MQLTKIKQFIAPITIRRSVTRKLSFFQLAKKNIVKGKKRVANKDLSKRVDEIVYGV